MSDENKPKDRSKIPWQLRDYAWKPGQSGNPKGRPPVKTFHETVRDVLEEHIQLPDGETASRRELLARVLVDECLKRNGGLIREVLAREWPAVTAVAVSGNFAIEGESGRDELSRRLDRIGSGAETRPNGRDH